MKNVWLPTVVALSLFTVVGCSQESGNDETEEAMASAEQTAEKMGDAAEEQMEQASQYLSDAAITAKVKTALFDNGGLDSSNISIETRDRVVYLSGTVSTDAAAETAGQLAAGVDDVEDVENDIVVSSY